MQGQISPTGALGERIYLRQGEFGSDRESVFGVRWVPRFNGDLSRDASVVKFSWIFDQFSKDTSQIVETYHILKCWRI